MTDKKHLEMRGRTWWYIRSIDAKLRTKLPMPHTGKAKFMVNLKTDSLILAQKARPHLNAQFDSLISVAKKRKVKTTEELLREEAKGLRDGGVMIGEFKSGDDEAPEFVQDAIRSVVQDLALERAERLEKELGEDIAVKFYQTATGTKPGTDIDEHLAMFIAKHPAKSHTNYKRETAVKMLRDWRSNLDVESITLPLAREFVDKVLSKGRKPATVNSYLTSLVSYWQWMIDQELLKVKNLPNPWRKLRLKKEKKDLEDQERAFTHEEMVRLFNPPKKPMREDVLHCATISALTTGRLDEIGSLKVKDIDLEKMTIFLPGSKTKTSPRLIPLHSALVPIMTKRIMGKKSGDWLFHELPERGKDALKGRSSPISQAFTRFRRKVGVGGMENEDSPADFHSFRRWAATRMRELDVPPHIINAIGGWKTGDCSATIRMRRQRQSR